LAQLDVRIGTAPSAEALMRQALALSGQTDLALAWMHRPMLSQGQIAEAAAYEKRLLARREQNPQYWLGGGLDHLQRARFSQAVGALERAQALTLAFGEVHRLLVITY
jgi:tetratricopeptide (TPR) repeat protein